MGLINNHKRGKCEGGDFSREQKYYLLKRTKDISLKMTEDSDSARYEPLYIEQAWNGLI